LRVLYLGYFAAVGVSIPFFPAYLRALGLSGQEVALVLGIGPLFYLAVPLVWGWLADRTRRPDVLLRVACSGASVALWPVARARTLAAMLVAYGLHQLFMVPILGLLDSLALDQTRRTGIDYTRLRL
jgi:PPP family 3-phenylpropionic acid transporter